MYLYRCRVALILGLVLFASACLANEERAMCAEREKLLAIAAEYIKKTFPHSADVLQLETVVLDAGNSWEVTYELPPMTAGGTPVITIDKKTCQVIKVLRYQ